MNLKRFIEGIRRSPEHVKEDVETYSYQLTDDNKIIVRKVNSDIKLKISGFTDSNLLYLEGILGTIDEEEDFPILNE
jgi:hypothetical protein